MNDGYSDDETLEFQEEEEQSTIARWPNSTSSERIRRSRASTDIAALMDTEMGEEAIREEVEEHTEQLPQKWIDHYRDKFTASFMHNRWTPPPVLEDRFRHLLNTAMRMCESGRADGTVDLFIQDNLNPLFKKWYYSGEAVDHWPVEIFLDIGETIAKVQRMVRGLIVAGAGSRDISANLWELFYLSLSDFRTNLLVGDRLHQMNIEGLDESMEAQLIKPDFINPATGYQKYARFVVLLYGTDGYSATSIFFNNNITASTNIEEYLRYFKCFKLMSMAMSSEKAYSTFGPLVYTGIDRLASATEEEMSCKNVRGPLDNHPLFTLYMFLSSYVYSMEQLHSNNENMLGLLRWRLRFALKALNEAPFNGRMSAVENLSLLVNDFGNLLVNSDYAILMRWLEEERAVDMLTRDNLHNASYVDRVLRVFDHMLRAGIFTTGDLSVVWEAQRGKHDVIQRNLADLIVRIVPNFDNDLLEVLFHKIQAGWVDGGVKERATLIDIVRKIGEQSAQNINAHRPSELDQALIHSSLRALWHFIRDPVSSKENAEAALHAHIKLLDDSRGFASFVKVYAELCSGDILKQNDSSATAARHLVHILELAGEEEEEEEGYERSPSRGGRYRQELISGLEESRHLVQSLCANIARAVRRPEDTEERLGSLWAFLHALNFFLSQSKDLRLSEEHASELWEALISKPARMQDMSIGFKFFMDAVDNEVLDKSMLAGFYNAYVLEVSASNISIDGYHCFESFFKAVNDMEGNVSLKNPDELQGAGYVRDLMLSGQPEVYHSATNLWVDNLQKNIYKMCDPTRTAALVQSLVNLIMEQYKTLEVSMLEAASRGLAPTHNPIYEKTKERTMRCIKVLSLAVNTMDEYVTVARRSVQALGKAAVGRPVFVNCKVPRREWDYVPYKFRNDIRADDLDQSCDVHENTTIAELRDLLKRQLSERLIRTRKKVEVDEVLEQFLLVHVNNEGAKTLHFCDYKRTLGEMGASEVVEVEIRLNKNSRQGEISPDTSTSDSDWMSPEEMAEDSERESILPSKALAADEGMIDRLLQVAESSDVDVAMRAFHLLMAVPQNAAKLEQLKAAVMHRDESRLLQLLTNTSDSRFVYYLMMLEAMILPADYNMRVDSTAMNAMMMFMRVLPQVGTLSKLMERAVAFRSLAIISITRILNLVCMSVTRIIISTRWGLNAVMNSTVGNLLRLSHVDLPVKWSKYMRVRRLSSFYSEGLSHLQSKELVQLVMNHSLLVLRVMCGVVLAAGSFQSANPIAEDSSSILISMIDAPLPMLDESTMDSDGCTIPALLECALYTTALLSAACPQECAQFIGAVDAPPDPVWTQAILSATFHKAENVRSMAWCLAVAMIDVVRSSLLALELIDYARGEVSLTDILLDMLPHCEGSEKYADQFVTLVKECVTRTHSWNATIVRLDAHIEQGVSFLDEALLHSTAQHSPFPDETYLKARIEVLTKLMRYTTPAQRERLGSAEGGPRLCERLLADFIFPSARAVETAAPVDTTVVTEMEPLPRSMTHMEMNSSSSLFDLTGKGEGCLPRSVSALPISTRRVAVCSGEGSQDGVFQLLLALCDCVPTNQVLMQTTIHRLFYSNPWTDKKDFEYLPQHVLRGEGDLVGLKNGGATCYMNSIFQQLFMVDEVREAVLNATIPEKVLLECRTSDSSSAGDTSGAAAATLNRGEYAVKVLAAVQTLFAHLLGSELDSYRPAEFWKVFAFKPNGESVNVREQQDAVEFHTMVTELIDAGLRKCGSEAVCEKTFRGQFADEKICKDCPHRYTKEEPFELLSLDVRSHNNLKDSLKEYVKGDVLENDNAYHCERCTKKVKAIKRLSLNKLPEVLIVQLKRFDFDWEKEMAVKFNDYFEFPFEIDIQPYTVEGLEKLEKGLPLENNKDYQFMLRGVVVHSGQAQGGHYTSYIRNRETGKWFKFDDSDVTPWDASESGAQQRWFGCTDSGNDSMGRGRKKIRTTYWNAYMLFYEKLETANRYLCVNPSSVASDMSTSSGVSSMTTTIPTALSSAVSSSGPSCVSPTPTTVTASSSITTTAVSPALRDLKIDQNKTRAGNSVSPVYNLHRHFSSMSLSSARIHMPPRLEEMLREGNRCVQLERVQYSTHFFAFVSSATGKALTIAEFHPECADVLMLATMKSFASFIVHNGLFASRDLIADGEMNKCSSKSWQGYMERLLANPSARLWFITHVLFSHEQAACFLFASDVAVRGFFQKLIMDTMWEVEKSGDASEACLRPSVVSPVAAQLAQSIRLFPRLSHLLGHLLGILPYKHNAAFRNEPITFYRTIILLADKPNMMAAIVRGGILNNLLSLFSSSHTHSDLSTLLKKDVHVYEDLHRVVANGLRTIQLETNETLPNPWTDQTLVIKRTELPRLEVLTEFVQKDGGNVRFIQHLVEMLRQANRTSDLGWAMMGILYLCHGNPFASCLVMDTICQFFGTAVNETATGLLLDLLQNLFSIADSWIECRFEHLFYKVQLTSIHAQPSVQGLLEMENVYESRAESLTRLLTTAVRSIPGVMLLIDTDERVQRFLDRINTIAVLKPSNRHYHEYYQWYAAFTAAAAANTSRSSDEFTSDSITESTGESTMDDDSKVEMGAERPAAYVNNKSQIINASSPCSAGQLSPSSRLGALTLSAGEKRPLPPTEEGEEADWPGSLDRKRSVGETMIKNAQWSSPPSASLPKIENYTASPMDDSDLLIFSSTPSTSSAAPSVPPPAYTELMGVGAAAAASAVTVAPSTPPVPPRPNAMAARLAGAAAKSSFAGDEFVVERQKPQ